MFSCSELSCKDDSIKSTAVIFGNFSNAERERVYKYRENDVTTRLVTTSNASVVGLLTHEPDHTHQ